jgi:hypothetical protein
VEVWLAVWPAEEPEEEKTRFMVHRHPHASPCLGSGLGLGKGGKGKGKGPVEDLASCLLMVSSPPTTTLVVVLVVRSLRADSKLSAQLLLYSTRTSNTTGTTAKRLHRASKIDLDGLTPYDMPQWRKMIGSNYTSHPQRTTSSPQSVATHNIERQSIHSRT